MALGDFNAATGDLALGGLVALGIGILILIVLLMIGLYIYTSLALYTIGKKLRYSNSWLAWIPIANIAMILQLGGFHWAWVFLILIPILGWIPLGILYIISLWRIYEKRKYPGYLSLIILLTVIPVLGNIAGIAHLVVIGLVAWRDN